MTTKNATTKNTHKKNHSHKSEHSAEATKPFASEEQLSTTESESSETQGSETNDVAMLALNKVFSSMSIDDIQRQLEARKTDEIQKLEARATELRTEIQAVEQNIATLKGQEASRRGSARQRGPVRHRARNERPMVNYLYDIALAAKQPMNAKELEARLSETDYKSESKNKYVQIFTQLSKHPNLFRKVNRGVFEAIPGQDPNATEAAPTAE